MDGGGAAVARLSVVLHDPDPDRLLGLAVALAGIAVSSGLTAVLHRAPGRVVIGIEGETECVDDLLAGVVPALPGARIEVGADSRTRHVTVSGPGGPPPAPRARASRSG